MYINFAGEKLWYIGADPVLHIGEKVYVHYDPADLSSVRVYDMATDKYLWTWDLDDDLLVDYLTNHREDIATAEKQIAESKKLVREYGQRNPRQRGRRQAYRHLCRNGKELR
ncbi:MAG: Mu transposase C-terminal domain-containing protein [Oscillospiraceae bacterium]